MTITTLIHSLVTLFIPSFGSFGMEWDRGGGGGGGVDPFSSIGTIDSYPPPLSLSIPRKGKGSRPSSIQERLLLSLLFHYNCTHYSIYASSRLGDGRSSGTRIEWSCPLLSIPFSLNDSPSLPLLSHLHSIIRGRTQFFSSLNGDRSIDNLNRSGEITVVWNGIRVDQGVNERDTVRKRLEEVWGRRRNTPLSDWRREGRRGRGAWHSERGEKIETQMIGGKDQGRISEERREENDLPMREMEEIRWRITSK